MSFPRPRTFPLRLRSCGLVAAALLLGSSPASSCGVCYCEAPFGLNPDGWGETRPADTRVLVSLSYVDAFGTTIALQESDLHWARGPTGAAVDFDTVETGGAGREVWLVPRSSLPIGESFEIWAEQGDSRVFEYAFTSVAPANAGGLLGGEPIAEMVGPSSTCGAFAGVKLTWTTLLQDGAVPRYQPVAEVQISQGNQSGVLFSGVKPSEGASSLIIAAPLDEEARRCWSPAAIPFPVTAEPLEATVTLYDQAGNATAFAPLTVSLADNTGGACPDQQGGCATAFPGKGAGRSFVLLLLGWILALLSWRRRWPPIIEERASPRCE